jgi:hypothetical protein
VGQFKSLPEDGGGLVPPARKTTYPVSLRLDKVVVLRLRVLAAKKRMRYQTLLSNSSPSVFMRKKEREGLV